MNQILGIKPTVKIAVLAILEVEGLVIIMINDHLSFWH